MRQTAALVALLISGALWLFWPRVSLPVSIPVLNGLPVSTLGSEPGKTGHFQVILREPYEATVAAMGPQMVSQGWTREPESNADATYFHKVFPKGDVTYCRVFVWSPRVSLGRADSGKNGHAMVFVRYR